MPVAGLAISKKIFLGLCGKSFVDYKKLTALMRKVILIFPDVISMTEFLLMNKVSKAQTNSVEKELSGVMTDKVLNTACKQYGAKIKESIQIKHF